MLYGDAPLIPQPQEIVGFIFEYLGATDVTIEHDRTAGQLSTTFYVKCKDAKGKPWNFGFLWADINYALPKHQWLEQLYILANGVVDDLMDEGAGFAKGTKVEKYAKDTNCLLLL